MITICVPEVATNRSMRTIRQTINAKLFDEWHLGAPKTPKFESLTTREQRILDWHFLRMKAWGIAVPALFLTSVKPAPPPRMGLAWRSPRPGYYFMFIIWPVGLAFWTSVIWTRTWVQNMTHRGAAVEYLREDGGTFGLIGIPKRDRESDIPLPPQGRRFD